MPTGNDTDFTVCDHTLTVNNNSVHVLPYAAFLTEPSDRLFVQGFFQLDIATRGNRIDVRDRAAGGPTVGVGALNEQTLFSANASVGYWLYRNLEAAAITGFAPMLELHYTTALQNTDLVSGQIWGQTSDTGYAFSNPLNRFDDIVFTIVLHTEIAELTEFRIAGAFPLGTGDDRFFDSELIFMLTRRF